jgi:hypothetical protein
MLISIDFKNGGVEHENEMLHTAIRNGNSVKLKVE